MEIQQDFKDLLKCFSEHGVEVIIVGGYALAYHGAPRFTGDLDLFIHPSPDSRRPGGKVHSTTWIISE